MARPTKREVTPIDLVIDFNGDGCPVETAMIKAGFARPDATTEFLSGYYPHHGVDRYHEARCPDWIAWYMLKKKKAECPVEVTVDFRCTYQPAEPHA